jgi:hypothetical protein
MGWKGRIAAVAGCVVSGAATVLFGQPAGAAETGGVRRGDVRRSGVRLPPGSPAAPFVLFADRGQVVSDGEAAVPCFFTATGTVDDSD